MQVIRTALVEDDPQTREGWSFILNQTPGFSCARTFPSAETFLESLPRLDSQVVLMDIGLPGIDGVAAILAAKKANFKGQFMMLTVLGDMDRVFDALTAGATGYLLKSAAPSELTAAIQQMISGGSPMSGAIAQQVIEHFGKTRACDANPAKEQRRKILTKREFEVVEKLAQGRIYKEIADELNISINTVRSYIRRIYEKLQVNSATKAIKAVIRDSDLQ